jgi:hypothetical protein
MRRRAKRPYIEKSAGILNLTKTRGGKVSRGKND